MDLRLRGKSLDACSLASYLSAYAAIDEKIYRKLLCDLIVQNDLHITASAVLDSAPAVMLDFQVSETRSTTAIMHGVIKTTVHAD